MHKPLRVSLLAVAAALASAAAEAQFTGHFTDASQPVIDSAAPIVQALGGASQQRLAQTLTVEQTGRVVGVFLPVFCGTGYVNVELRDLDKSGMPGWTVYDATTVPAATVGYRPGHFTYIQLSGVLKVKPGVRLAIVVSNAKGSCAFNFSPLAANYAGGQGYFEALPNPPGWIAQGSFANTPDDLPFQLVLAP